LALTIVVIDRFDVDADERLPRTLGTKALGRFEREDRTEPSLGRGQGRPLLGAEITEISTSVILRATNAEWRRYHKI
jgi:hypothetical protein